MRFLLLVILSSSLFIAPSGSKASEVRAKQLTTNFEGNPSATKILSCVVSDDYAVAIITSNDRTSSSSQYRYYPLINFVYSVARQYNLHLFYKQKYFAEPHLYCKRIGLKLLFPEHYFW